MLLSEVQIEVGTLYVPGEPYLQSEPCFTNTLCCSVQYPIRLSRFRCQKTLQIANLHFRHGSRDRLRAGAMSLSSGSWGCSSTRIREERENFPSAFWEEEEEKPADRLLRCRAPGRGAAAERSQGARRAGAGEAGRPQLGAVRWSAPAPHASLA